MNPLVVALLAQQRVWADGHAEGGVGQLLRAELQFRADALQQLFQQRRFFLIGPLVVGCFAEAFVQTIESTLVNRGVAWHLHRLDRLAGCPLKVVDEATLARGDKQHGLPRATGPAGATDAVDVGLAVERHVVVDHQPDAIHIQAPSGHIGGHKDVDGATAQPFHRPLPLVLRHITVEHGHLMPARLKRLGHGEGDGLGAGENDHPFTTAGIEHPLQSLQLVGHRHGDRTLANPFAFLILGADRDLGWILQIALRQPTDLRWHGRGEQHHLPFLRQLLQDPFDIVDEAHPQHFIGLIQHQAA